MSVGSASCDACSTLSLMVSKPNNESYALPQLSSALFGAELWQFILKKHVPSGSDTFLLICVGTVPLALNANLADQGVKDGDRFFLSFRQVTEAEQQHAAEKVWHKGVLDVQEVHMWDSIKTLGNVKECPANYGWPAGLQSLTFDDDFDQSMRESALPVGLQSLTFGYRFNQSMQEVTLPAGLQSLTFGYRFNQSMQEVALPVGLQSLTFGYYFNQSMQEVALPADLRSLTFGESFDQSMQEVALPAGLQSLTFGYYFNQSMEGVIVPAGLQSLTFGRSFDQILPPEVALPFGCKVSSPDSKQT